MSSEIEIVSRWAQAPGPTNVEAIFADLGVEYTEKAIPGGYSGWIEKIDGKFHVVVNEKESEQRKLFTAAHELGHYLLHRDLLNSGNRMARHTDRLFENSSQNDEQPFRDYHEAEANEMAAQILMPAGKVRKNWGEGQADLAAFAKTFGVSSEAMRIRLAALGIGGE